MSTHPLCCTLAPLLHLRPRRGARTWLAGSPPALIIYCPAIVPSETAMGTIDNQFQATGPGQFGFFATPKTGDGNRSSPGASSAMAGRQACWHSLGAGLVRRGRPSRTATRSTRRAAPSSSPVWRAYRLIGWACMVRCRTRPKSQLVSVRAFSARPPRNRASSASQFFDRLLVSGRMF
jgi:hypothetical protein